MSKPLSGKWAIVCVASGFTGPTIVSTFDDPASAKKKFNEAMADFEENNWSHHNIPTLYKRVEILDCLDSTAEARTESGGGE